MKLKKKQILSKLKTEKLTKDAAEVVTDTLS